MKALILSSAAMLSALSTCVASPALSEPSITLESGVITNLTYLAPDAKCMPINNLVAHLMKHGFSLVDHARDRNNASSTLSVFHYVDMSKSIVVVSDVENACIIAGY